MKRIGFPGDEGTKAYAEVLKSESKLTLQNLSIQYNLISIAGAKAMAEALKTNKTLQLLGHRYKESEMTGNGFCHPAKSLHQNL